MSLQNEADVLLTVPPFTVLDPPQLKLLAAASEQLQFKPGETFVAQGETGNAVLSNPRRCDGTRRLGQWTDGS